MRTGKPARVFADLERETPVPVCLVVLDADHDPDGAAELLRRLHPRDGDTLPCPVVVVAPHPTEDLEREVLREGASEVVALEEVDDERLVRAALDACVRFASEKPREPDDERRDVDRGMLEAVLAAAPVGVVVVDEHGRLLRFSPAFERIWGVAATEEALADCKRWKGFWADGGAHHGQPVADDEWALARALRGEHVTGDIVTIEPFDRPGERKTIILSGAPVRARDGRVCAAVCAQMDITDRLRAEEAVRSSEERLRFVARATNDVIYDWDLLTDQLSWNEAVETHFGEPPASLAPGVDVWASHLHPDDRARVLAKLDEHLASTTDSWTDEYRFRRADGTYATVLDRGYILRTDGRATRMIGAMLDVTELRRAEAALQENEERFRLLADNISPHVWIADETGSVLWFNRRWFEYTGTTPDEVLGAGWRKVLDPEELPRVEKKFRHALELGENWEDTFTLRAKTGERRAFLSRALPVRDHRGRVRRWFGTNTDIDEQRRDAEALRDAVRMRDTFLQIAAHELRTPLMALGLQLEALEWLTRRPTLDPERIAAKVDLATRQTERLARLVEVLLDVSRMTSGRLELETTKSDLADIVTESVDRMREIAARAGCDVRVHLETRAVGYWDRSRMEQAVTNLVSNAVKYGRGRPVDVTLEAKGDYLELHVRDRGIGIPLADQARIFERFERAVSVDHYGGLGLGLYIAREVVRAHGGTIFVGASAPGEGTTFTVRLPRPQRG